MKNSTIKRVIATGILCGMFQVSGTAADSAAGTDPVTDFFRDGKVNIDIRARYEGVDQTGLRDADAVTLRTRIGYTTAEFSGLSGSIEFEDIRALDEDAYNQAGLNPAASDRAIVADPVGTEINQAWVAYHAEATTLKLGRQRLVYDNARFIGDVGWRQNMQTFDAFSIRNTTIDGLVLNYAYIDQVNRVLGHDHPAGVWDSKSHLVNATYEVLPDARVGGYAYLLDFDNAAASSNQTYGINFAGTRDFDSFKLAYRAEFARQADYGSSTLDYAANYYLVDLAGTVQKITFGGGYEVLGTDNGVGFQTPLATLHGWNGWADMFLGTPSNGLRDFYLKASAPITGKFAATGVWHKFKSDIGGEKFGRELDLLLSYQHSKNLSAAIKYADFDSTSSRPDVRKLWVQAQFVF